MKSNQITFKVSGKYALFTDPLTKIGGEKSTLMVPTAEALIGITSSIYWKPSIKWKIMRVTVMNEIMTESKGIRPIKYDGGNDLSFYTYLKNVEYQVTAQFSFNHYREDLKQDWNEGKHYEIAKRSLVKGGRRDIFLGTRECQGYVEEIKENKDSYYGKMGDMQFGLMFHSFVYPDQSGKDDLEALFWRPIMKNGVIEFCSQEECPVRRVIHKMSPKAFDTEHITLAEQEIL